MTVTDMDLSVEFYTRVLTFEKESETERSGPEFDLGTNGAIYRSQAMSL